MIGYFDQKRGKVEQANSQWDPPRSFPRRDANDSQIDVILLHFNICALDVAFGGGMWSFQSFIADLDGKVHPLAHFDSINCLVPL